MRKLFSKLFRNKGLPPDQLSLAKEFLDTITLAVRGKEALFMYVAAGDRDAGILIRGGGDDPVIEYLYNFAAASVYRIQAEEDIGRRACPNCQGLDGCQMSVYKGYPCKFFDKPACDAEAAHHG